MSATDVQVRFAAEFALFLVSLAGLGFAFLRSDLLVVRPLARLASAAGFAALAAAALLSGALIVEDTSDAVVVALRLGGIVLLAGASLACRPERGGRELLRIGLLALLVAEVILAGDSSSLVSDAARGIGALGIGACLVGASARVISARVAASGAMVLFAVITVMAVALSAVISDNVEDEALRRYGARAQSEAEAVRGESVQSLLSARLIGTALEGAADDLGAALARVTDPARDPSQSVEERATVAATLRQFLDSVIQDPRQGPVLVVGPTGRPDVFLPTDLSPSLLTALSGSPVVRSAIEARAEKQSVVVAGDGVYAVAAAPIGGRRGATFRGVVVVTRAIDVTYLNVRVAPFGQEQPGGAMALADRTRVLASSGEVVDDDLTTEVVEAALGSGEGSAAATGGRFVVARPVEGADGTPVAAFVVSAPRAQEDATRQDLFRVLFLVAMGAAAAALALSALVGERIGSGLRRLTEAATAIRSGNLDARVGATTDDELGTLGQSFDAMSASLRELTADLRTAVADEAELRARLEAVVGGMGEALVAVDGDGSITDFNAAAEELFDLPARKARGRAVTEVVRMRSVDGRDLSRRLRRPVLEGWSDTGSVRLAQGSEVPVSISAGTLRGPDNEVAGAVFVLRDERREAELERMKTEFLANISHELRTPLTPIKGFASILQTRDLPPAKAKGFADEISSAADQMERIVGQLVNFATIVGGRLAVDPEPVAVRPLVDGVVKPWRGRVDATHRITRRVPTGLPRVVLDRAHVAQALDALVDNAVKYSPDGGKIVVAAEVLDGKDGPQLEISVTDQGVGIPADRVDAVLQDFAQADASTTRRFGGLGLGLALVHRIARAHGGELRVTSTVGSGTTATLVLPVDGPEGPSR